MFAKHALINVMSSNPPHVEILLSTYNGDQFLRQQLDSLFDQTYKNWQLLVRDDGSADNTIEIIKEYSVDNPGKIKIFSDEKNQLGACFSFASLLAQSKAPYVMFCDQDDTWLPEKIEKTLEHMIKAESQNSDLPILVHTDMLVADNKLNIIADSFWRYQNLDPEGKKLRDLLMQNNITGCALMANRALADAALPVHASAVIHDWWLALVAAGLGKIIHVNTPLIKYRQHNTNVLGATKYSCFYFFRRLKTLGLTIDLLRRIVKQAEGFYSIYNDRLAPEDRDITREFSLILDRGMPGRLVSLFGHKFKCHGFLRSLGIFTLLLLVRKNRSDNSCGKAGISNTDSH